MIRVNDKKNIKYNQSFINFLFFQQSSQNFKPHSVSTGCTGSNPFQSFSFHLKHELQELHVLRPQSVLKAVKASGSTP